MQVHIKLYNTHVHNIISNNECLEKTFVVSEDSNRQITSL